MLILNVFETTLWIACEQFLLEVLDIQSTVLKCCWKSGAVAWKSSIKVRFCKTPQISQKESKMESLFRKTVIPQAYNCTKKDTITGVFLYLCEYIFSFFTFLFQKRSIFPLLRRIRLLNDNVNKKKSMCENVTSEVMWHKNCRRQAPNLTYPLCEFNKTSQFNLEQLI